MFSKQFIDKTFWVTLASIAVTHLVAVFVRGSVVELPLMLLVIIGCAYLAVTRLPLALFVAFAEIMVGGHGHLLEPAVWGVVPLSLRSGIFIGVMFGWAIGLVLRRYYPRFIWSRDLAWLILIVAITVGVFIGFRNQGAPKFNDLWNIFDDVNGFLTLFYLLPIISVIWDSTLKRQLLQVFAATVTWITLMTLSLSFIFNHFPGKLLDPVYKFVRDSRLAEVTLQVYAPSYFYRVFMPSQLFAVIATVLLLAMMLTLWKKERLSTEVRLAFILVGAAGLLSLSRSFALGFVAAAAFVGVVALLKDWRNYKLIIWRVFQSVVLAVGGLALAALTVLFPLPTRPDLTDAAFYKTSSEVGRSAGVASRWQLFDPLQAKIAESPIWGSGFGTEVTYQSSDPRIIAETGNGKYTTFRFEWGYQDLWVKMGLLGLISYLVYLACLSRAIRQNIIAHENTWLPLGLGAGIIVLFVTHIFSPYLNHPIGLGYMLFVLPFLDFEVWKKSWVTLALPTKLTLPAQEMTPAMAEISSDES